MNIRTIKELLLTVVLVTLPLSAEAATATARVSANIVPMASFSISGAAIFSGSIAKQDSNGIVNLNTSNVAGEAKLRIASSRHDNDISVSLPIKSDKEFYSERIVNSKLAIERGNINKKGEHELNFGGEIDMASVADNKSSSVFVYITSNFK